MFFLVRDDWLQHHCSTACFPYATLFLLWSVLSVRAVFTGSQIACLGTFDLLTRDLEDWAAHRRIVALSDRVPLIDHQLSEVAATYGRLRRHFVEHNFRGSQLIRENRENFAPRNFCAIQYLIFKIFLAHSSFLL